MNIKYPLVLDGGLSNVLEEQGCDLNHKLWSAILLDSNPEAIIQAHLSYLNAGAQCITTSSYQASISGFMSIGYNRKESENTILKTVQLAELAIERFMKLSKCKIKPLIAASVGPYGAYLSDGSEYHGDYGVSNEVLYDFHKTRIKLLDGSNANLIACETIPSFQEAKVLADILKSTNKSAWISFSCKDESHINDGTPIKECIAYFEDHSNIFALGVNCTAPKYISGLIKIVKSESQSKRVVVYPNSGEAYNAESKTWLGLAEPESFVQMSKEWQHLGADIIGGCCRIGPSHIKRIKEIINNF